jgi:hypothetical protein
LCERLTSPAKVPRSAPTIVPADVPPALVAAPVTAVAVELPLPVVDDPDAAAVPLGPTVVVVPPELPLHMDLVPAQPALTPILVPGRKEWSAGLT